MGNRFKYYKEKNMAGLVMILLLALNLAVVIFGCFVLKVLPENRQLSLGDAFWESLKLILDPGGFLGTKLSAVTTIVTSVIVLCGTITFTGGVIGYVTNIITTTIENSKNGSKELKLKNYTLILNWNERAMSIILDYVHDARRNNKNEYIVILCNKEKSDLENYILKEIKSYRNSHAVCNKHNPKIVVRKGNPQHTSDLDLVNYYDAKAIYVMQIEGDQTPDFEVIQTCMAISAGNKFLSSAAELIEEDEVPSDELEMTTRIVAETSDEKTAKMLSELYIAPIKIGAYKQYFYLSPIRNDLTLGKLFAQIAMNPSMSFVFQEILSQAGSEFVEYDIDDEKTFDFELKRLKYAIPVYDDGKGGRVYLSGDSLKENASFEELDEDEVRITEKEISITPNEKEEDLVIAIWGYNRKLRYIFNSLSANNKANSKKQYKVIILASEDQAEKIEELIGSNEVKDLLYTAPLFTRDGYNIEEILSKLPDKLHSMMILSRDDFADDEKDKEVFEVWMSIHHEMALDNRLKEKLEGKLILEVSSTNNANLLQLNAEDQVVISSELGSLFMVQMATGSTIEEILLDLICSKEDSDIYAEEIIEQNQYDLMLMSANELFSINSSLEFASKQDMVNKVFYGSQKEYLPIGLVIYGTVYLFTNGGKTAKEIVGNGDVPCMSDGYLIGGDGEDMYLGNDGFDYKNELLIEPDYEVVLVHRVN